VQKDFNIEDDAGGAGKVKIKNYIANVTDGTLEIHFYWAGKGTTGIPNRGVYGPLISAISVNNPGKLNFMFLLIMFGQNMVSQFFRSATQLLSLRKWVRKCKSFFMAGTMEKK
jgi:hypothetical protein